MTDELYVCKNCGCSNHDVIADKKCPATGKEHEWSYVYSTGVKCNEIKNN